MNKFLVQHKSGRWRTYFRPSVEWRPIDWQYIVIYAFTGKGWELLEKIGRNKNEFNR